MYRSELLPLPDGPVIAAASPGESVKLTSDSTVSGPRGVGYCLPTPETFNTADLHWRDESPTRRPRSVEPPTARWCSERARRRTRDPRASRTARDRTTALCSPSASASTSSGAHQQTAAGLLDDLGERAASWLNDRNTSSHRLEQEHPFRLVVGRGNGQAHPGCAGSPACPADRASRDR